MTNVPTPKPRTRKSRAAGDEKSRTDTVLLAALAHVPADGFTDSTLAAAAREAGISEAECSRLFPDGALSLVDAFSRWADAEMIGELSRVQKPGAKIRERITAAVLARITVLRPHKEAARRAAAFLTLPPHAARGMTLLYRTVDEIWRGIGDTSTDFNFYTKRAILAGVYTSTLMRWFTDTGDEETDTREFLDRRIGDVMRFEKFKAQVKERAAQWPSLADIFKPRQAEPKPRPRRA
jgi:ubiquinone biosynthesis protein COQ9